MSGSADKYIMVWNYKTLELIQKIIAHNEPIKFVTYIPDTNQIASASADKTIKLWSLENNYQLIHKFEGHSN